MRQKRKYAFMKQTVRYGMTRSSGTSLSKSCRDGFQHTNALPLRLWVMVCKREAVAAPMVAVKRRRIKGTAAEAAFPINLDDLTAVGLYPL